MLSLRKCPPSQATGVKPIHIELRDYTDDELKRIPPLSVGYNHLRNPFRHLMKDPLGSELANRWAWVHWPGDMAAANGQSCGDTLDPTDILIHDLALVDSGWHRVEHPETGAITYFPVTAKDVGAWEERCRTMHESQTRVAVEEKPVMAHHDSIRMQRGD